MTDIIADALAEQRKAREEETRRQEIRRLRISRERERQDAMKGIMVALCLAAYAFIVSFLWVHVL